MTYREIDLTKDNEQVVMMMMWYRDLVDKLKNPLHQSEWPLGVVEKKDMEVKYIGAFDGKTIAGLIGYTTVYFETKQSHGQMEIASRTRKDDFTKLLAIFEIMMFVREEYRGKGVGSELWKRLVTLARDQGLPLWVGNNTEGGDASLRKAVGNENVQLHELTIVPHVIPDMIGDPKRKKKNKRLSSRAEDSEAWRSH